MGTGQQEDGRGERGQGAARPKEIPRRGWWDIARRVKDEQTKDNLTIVAAGVAFYWLLAVFPAIAGAVSIFGLVADPGGLQQQAEAIGRIMPQQAYQVLQRQLEAVASYPGGALSFGLIASLLLTLWSANKGMKALFLALNIVYDEEETRGVIKLNALSLLLTFGFIILGLLAVSLVIAVPALVDKLGLPGLLQVAVTTLRWPLLAAFLIAALAVVYQLCPDRKAARWRWVSWGSIAATALWLLVSILFSVYVSNFGSYGKTYGSVGAVIILLLWLFLTAYSILLGGELNAEMERQTEVDSTRGPARPKGQRGATMADTAGETSS